MKKLLLILFYIGYFFFLSTKLYAQSNQTVTSGSNTTTVNFAGSCIYNWVNSDPSIGLAASGTGNIPSFTAVNIGKSPVTATITATPVPNGFAYIANNGFGVNSVSVIDIASNKVIKTIPVGANPYGVTVNHAGTFAYVGNTSGNTGISVINTTTNLVSTTIPLNSAPGEMVLSPDDSKLYVANYPYITIINTGNNTIVGSFTEGGNFVETGLAISPDGKRLYISDGTDNDVLVVNTINYSKIADIMIGYNPHGIVLSPDGSRLYVPTGIESIYNPPVGINDNLTIVNTANEAIITTIPVGEGPYNVVLSTDGSRAYVANSISNSVSVINTINYSIVTTIPVGKGPAGLSSTADGSEIFVTNDLSNDVNVINTKVNSVAATISIGTGTSPISYGNFIASSSGCGGPVVFTITVDPTIAPATITANAASGAISACVGTASASPAIQQFTVSGSNLTAPATATASAGFEVSLTAGSGYGKSVTLNQSAGNLSNTTIYVRSAAGGAAGPIAGNVVLSSTGAADQNVAVSGVVNALPTVNTVSNQTVNNGSSTTAVNFTGSGSAFTWTNDTPAIGLAASGTGNISPFTTINTSNAPVTATITVNPEMPSLAYIANNQEALSVIDLNTNTVVANIQVGQAPIGTAVDKYNNRVYVANQQSQNISVINSITNTVTATIDIRPGWDPSGLALSPDGTRLYITEWNNNYLTVINTADNSIIASIPVGQNPWGLAVSPDGNFVYVVQAGDNNISIVNTATNKVIGTLPAGQTPNDIQISPDGTYLYVSNYNSHDVTVINTRANAVTATINVGVVAFDEALSPDGSRLYVTNINDKTVTVINTLNNSVITTVNVNQHPEGLCFSADGTKVYVINNLSGNLSVINTSDNTVSTGISVGISSTFGKFISAGSGCPGTPITFTITVNPLPPPTVTTDGSLTPLTTIYGSPSSIDRFTVSGTAITSGILITPPAGFEVSLDDKTFSPTVTVNGTGNIYPTAIFIRLAASTHVGSYSGNVTISTNNAADATIMVPVSTVTRASLTITADNKTRPLGVVNPPLTVTYSGFVNNDSADQLTSLPTLTTDATISSAVGQYAINVNHDAASPDYMFNYNPGILTITPVLSPLSIPNTFTPNGDGINDTWVIQDLEYYPKSTINIFNRWGQKLFTSIGYPIPWDGTYQGKALSAGTYYYIIDPKNGQAMLTGWVAIIR